MNKKGKRRPEWTRNRTKGKKNRKQKLNRPTLQEKKTERI